MKISSTLAEFSRIHNIADTMFALDIKNSKLPLGFSKVNKASERELILSSSLTAIKYSVTSRKRWARKDPNTEISLSSEYHVWDYNDWPKFKFSPNDDLLKFGYEKKVSVEIPCMINPNWVGRFYLMIDNSRHIEPQALTKLYKDLSNIHYMIIQSNIDDINPFLDYGLIKESDIAILSMLANGHSRESIAKASYLSSRGVDYRIVQLKKKLCASNHSSLINSAYHNFLIK